MGKDTLKAQWVCIKQLADKHGSVVTFDFIAREKQVNTSEIVLKRRICTDDIILKKMS